MTNKIQRTDAIWQPVLVCDLDGCLVDNPPEAMAGVTIPDPDYWANHWNDPVGATPNWELSSLVRSLVVYGRYKLVILTARPDCFESQTRLFLNRIGFNDHDYTLIMRQSDGQILPSGPWKREVVQYMLDLGYNVQLMIEDYKPNVEAVRSLIPVLLYERKK